MYTKFKSKIIDSHSHSNFSPDSKIDIEIAAERISNLGLGGVAITDHLDLDTPDREPPFEFDIAEQQAAIDRVQEHYAIKILKGIEIGLQTISLENIREKLKGHTFDTIIASLHFVDGIDPYEGEYYIGKTEKEAYSRYLELLFSLIKEYSNFDTLGHFDYIARYAPYENRTIEYSDLFDEMFKFLIYNGKALEINTNTYRTRNGRTPVLDKNILKRYLQLGGELITIGSDAHTADRYGEQFPKYLTLVKECGFKYITHFEKRKPLPQKIEI